jgi:hypothetical protein
VRHRALSAQSPSPHAPFTVHEWGTFTSIAGEDGGAVAWLPQSGSNDLPCFVERSAPNIKGYLRGTVRMETPVIYFYSPAPMHVSVDVFFHQGSLTEWYPHAAQGVSFVDHAGMSGTLNWPDVTIEPSTAATFPQAGPSHYYRARETAAAPLRVGGQVEKFLFYRGVGQFQPPLNAVANADGGASLRSLSRMPIGDVILFENRRGAMTFSSHHLATTTATLPRPDLDDASGAPLSELQRILVANGLYEKEAQAMVETWKDSWFEEGARLLYIVPRADVDAILPLTIAPAPSATARVFVGRIELMTPATLRDVSEAISSNDRAVLARYGRFLQPIAKRAGLAASVPEASVAPSSCR